jgi:TRAP transporter TAXI family solute receptor
MRVNIFLLALGAGWLTAAAASAGALPREMTWTSQRITSIAFAQTEAIGKMFERLYGAKLKVLRGAAPADRLAPLRAGEASFCVCGSGAFFAQEGVFAFADPAWGPQPLRVVAAARNRYNFALATAGDANIRHARDLKGKRISWLRGRDAINWSTAANLAFAGLTWRDVEIVDTATFKASIDAVIKGDSDAALVTTIHPYARKLQASARGLSWLKLPHGDAEGWRRLLAVHPLALKNTAPRGIGITPGTGHQGFAHAYPVLITTAGSPDELVYQVLKALMEQHKTYAPNAPGGDGWALENQAMLLAWPQHPGAIRYWRERGLWNARAQANHERLLGRQSILRAAWATFTKSGENTAKSWTRIRAAALAAAGRNPVIPAAGLR